MTNYNLTIGSLLNEPSNLIALCALIVSGLSFFLTVYTIWTQRIHDRLAVKPLAYIHLDNFHTLIRILVKNDGLGPMIIKSIETYRQDDNEKHNTGWPPNTFDKSDFNILGSVPRFMEDLENTPVLNGASIVLFKHEFNLDNPSHVGVAIKTRDGFKDLVIKIKYTSIFPNDKFETTCDLTCLRNTNFEDFLL